MRVFEKMKLVNFLFAAAALAATLYFVLPEGIYEYFSSRGFMPHGHCYLWSPPLVWIMVSTNLLIGLAYLSISISLYYLVKKIRLPFSSMFLAFGAFIGACGATHFMGIYTLWIPNYWAAAFVNVITAIASVATAVLVFPLMPRVIELARSAKLSEKRKNQLIAANRELETNATVLTALNKELEAFSYSVSHDLRAPLRGIDGFSQALSEDYGDQLSSEAQQYIKFIREGTQQMGKTIDDLLKLSRLTRTELKYDRVNLSLLAKNAIAVLKQAEPERAVEVRIPEEIYAEGDPGLLKLVFENLLSNAWKFTSNRPLARIEFGLLKQEGDIIYFIKDNGAGFDMRYMDKLFGAFQRLHTATEFAGTGVGLATAKRIIQRHSGKIWAEAAPEEGATFYFTLNQKGDSNGQ